MSSLRSVLVMLHLPSAPAVVLLSETVVAGSPLVEKSSTVLLASAVPLKVTVTGMGETLVELVVVEFIETVGAVVSTVQV